MIWAIVPAKILEQAKTRLAYLLSPAERRALSLAMLRDVINALQWARRVDRVAIVTADTTLGAAASDLGVAVLSEGKPGQNVALESGVAYCREQGAKAVLVVSSDLPLLRSMVVDRLVARGMQGDYSRLLLAASRDGAGTNALFQRPPGILPFLFGPASLERHQQAAAERGITVEVVRAREFAFDIDEPADLVDLVTSTEHTGSHTHTRAVLLQMRLLARLQEPFYGESPVS